MSETEATPTWRTTALWGILALLLIFGSVGSATFVYGLTWLVGGDWVLGVALTVVGAIVALLAFLFMAGILYRVDRYRGKNGRRVELFE